MATYIDFLRSFHQWQKMNHLSGHARLLYYSLLAVFNEARWPERVQIDNLRLMLMIDTRTEKTAISARDELVDAGLIEYVKGKKKSPNIYRLKYAVQKDSKSDSVFDSENDSVSGSESDSVSGSVFDSVSGSVSGSESDSHIKTKTKTKTKNILPPISPPAGDAFERFWSAYPRKVGKQAAKKSFIRVKVPIETLLSAIEWQKRSDQWTKNNGQFIPHPATWLNQGRWDDELQADVKSVPFVYDYGSMEGSL